MNTLYAARRRLLLTDHPWPGTEIEQSLLGAADIDLVEAPPGATTADLIALAADVDAVMTCWAQVPRSVLEAPGIKVVSRLGVGLDNIDTAAASELGIVVTFVPDYCVDEVSDHVVALTMGWTRGLLFFDSEVRAGRWQPGSFTPRRFRDLTVGVWGFGRIGRRTAEKLAGLGATVMADDRHPELADGFAVLPPAELAAAVDILTLHMPMTPANAGIVNRDLLARMRSDALLVNVSRGGLVDVDALADALDAGQLGAAALDVLPDEPHVPDRLRDRPDVTITPHVAFSSSAAVTELRQRACADAISVLNCETVPYFLAPTGQRR